MVLSIPFHILEVDDSAFEYMKTALYIERLKAFVKSNLHAPDSFLFQVTNRLSDDLGGESGLLVLRMYGQVDEECI